MSGTDLAIDARADQQRRLEAVGLMTAGLAHDLANSVQTLTSAGNILKAHDLVAHTANLPPTSAGAAVALRHVATMVTALLAFVRSQTDAPHAFDPAHSHPPTQPPPH